MNRFSSIKKYIDYTTSLIDRELFHSCTKNADKQIYEPYTIVQSVDETYSELHIALYVLPNDAYCP